jgi:hypothetical protein
MNSQRITAPSKENIKAADRAELIEMKELGCFTVKLWKGERATFVTGSQSVMPYPTADHARRAIKRIRPDLELTSFN